jgi:hypothetical protein
MRSEYEIRRRRQNEAKAPKAAALRDRLVGATDYTDDKGKAVIVGLLAAISWYLSNGVEIPTDRARDIEVILERMGCGKFPRPAA